MVFVAVMVLKQRVVARIALTQVPATIARFVLFERASFQIRESLETNPDSFLAGKNEIIADAAAGTAGGVAGALVVQGMRRLVAKRTVPVGLWRSLVGMGSMAVVTAVQFTIYGPAR